MEKVNVSWYHDDAIELDEAIVEADMQIDRNKTKVEYCNGAYFGSKLF